MLLATSRVDLSLKPALIASLFGRLCLSELGFFGHGTLIAHALNC